MCHPCRFPDYLNGLQFIAVLQERVFKDPSMRLFEYNSKSLLASIPTMLAFPKVIDPFPLLLPSH